MNEYPTDHLEKEAKEQKKRDYIELGKEISERGEVFPFSGVTSKAYADLKAAAEAYPEDTTPIDKLMEMYRDQGIKIVVSKNPSNATVFIMPRYSDNVDWDSIFPRQLELHDDMDEDLKRLIKLNIELNNS